MYVTGIKSRTRVLCLEAKGLDHYRIGICQRLCCGHVILELGPEEVENENTCFGTFCQTRKRIPYGELSGVDKNQDFFCW